MRKNDSLKRILCFILCLTLMMGIFTVSVSAAKEMFTTYQIENVAITGIDAPVAGDTFDFTAEESSQKYNIIKVAWKQQGGSSYITNTSSSASAGNRYTVCVVLEVATANHYFKTDSTRKPAVSSVTVNGNTANASNTQDYSLFSIDASKYEHDTTYQKYLVVEYTFPTVESAPIKSIEFDIPALVPGERVPTVWHTSGISISGINGSANNGQINVNSFEWSLQDGTPLAGNDVFEYGKKYALKLTLNTAYGASFATDPNHFLAQPGKPFPAVTVKMNGKDAAVLPTYDSFSNLFVVASCVFDCDTAAQIKTIALTGIDEPVSGKAPDYTFTGGVGYDNNGRNDAFYKNGMCWSEVGSSYILSDGSQAFLPGKAYQADIRIKAKDGYEFATNSYGNIAMTATVNGKSASVSGNKNEILITYVFPVTGSIALAQVGVGDIDAPEEGKTPDYTVSYNNVNYGPASYNDASNKNGVSWYCETDKKIMSTGSKFEAGKTYSVMVTIWANDGYSFRYQSGIVNVAGTVNGKAAVVTSRNNTEVTLSYTFPAIAEHKHSANKVAEVKATCTGQGKKAYYLCSSCGKSFEDSGCTKEILNVNAWGIIDKLEHTGGKATCSELAKCKNCGLTYGTYAQHNFGTAWDYKDATGHAHKCKVCGINDTVVAHSGGNAKCGEVAKCAECKTEYGEPVQHKWSTEWSYTDTKGHAHKCSVCGDHDEVQEHSGGTADCQNKAKCAVCGTEYGKTGEHKWGTAWDYTSSQGHAHVCTVNGCDEHDDVVKHTPGKEATENDPQLCTVCNYMIAPKKSHVHNTVKVDAVEESCTSAGKKAHYYCESCNGYFSDSKGLKAIEDESTLTVPASGHKESKWKYDANSHWKDCTVKDCGEKIDGTEGAHEFAKNNRCSVCGYKQGSETADTAAADPKETKPADSTTAAPGDTGTVTDKKDDITEAPDSEKVGTDTNNNDPSAPAQNDNTIVWIVAAAAIGVAVVCVVVMTVVLVKNKNKKA